MYALWFHMAATTPAGDPTTVDFAKSAPTFPPRPLTE
jgi:hypothetical protein